VPFSFSSRVTTTIAAHFDYHVREMTSPTDGKKAPEVSAADLRAVWTTIQEVQAHGKPGESSSIGIHALQQVCATDANVEAVWARTLMLQILNHVKPGWSKGANMDKVFELAARFPMRIMEPGVQYDEPPFDVREFMTQLAAQ
jgi:hypothetical protein